MQGQPADLGLAVEDVKRDGVDGQAWRLLDRRAEPFELTAICDCDDFVSANKTYTDILAVQGSLVDWIDDYGTIRFDLMLLHVERVALRPIIAGSAAGGVSTGKLALLTLRLRLQASKVQPGVG